MPLLGHHPATYFNILKLIYTIYPEDNFSIQYIPEWEWFLEKKNNNLFVFDILPSNPFTTLQIAVEIYYLKLFEINNFKDNELYYRKY